MSGYVFSAACLLAALLWVRFIMPKIERQLRRKT
jgi:hypothetical protein